MKPIFEKLPINSGGELKVIQTTEHLYIGGYERDIGGYERDMYCGVYLDVEEAKSLRSLLNRYIEGVENE